MEEMWNNPSVRKQWNKAGWKRGNVGIEHDNERRLYISRKELKAVAEIILRRYFSSKRVQPTVPCALAEMISMRLVDGKGQRTGLMGIDYATARWLHKDLGFQAYMIDSAEDLSNPFVSMYFGIAYLAWLSEYEGRERTPQFIVQAYLGGPQNATEENGPQWLKFEEALSLYDPKKDEGSCCIL
ncbi:hypothetical protein Leryth_014410 [Lithospermum erythrorhizon]|nr:hypothetical protein Leryth_014410 [Lithospermum erythrorhizon]